MRGLRVKRWKGAQHAGPLFLPDLIQFSQPQKNLKGN